jgi:nitrite reductase (NADH) small subunit
MNERCWIWITPVENLPPREGRVVTVAGREIALFNLGSRVVATASHCPHKGGPLADGMLAGDQVVCPLHSFRFEPDSGECDQSGVCAVPTFPVEVAGGVVRNGVPVA